MHNDEFQKKLLETFKVEADEHLNAIASGLLMLEKARTDADIQKMAELIHREAHSLKGAARSINLLDIELICQLLESIFADTKKLTLTLLPQQYDILHQVINTLLKHLVALEVDKLALEQGAVASMTLQLRQLRSPAEVPPHTETKVEAPAPVAPVTQHDIKTVRVASSALDTVLLKAEEMLAAKLINQRYESELMTLTETTTSWKKEWDKILKAGNEIDSDNPEAFRQLIADSTQHFHDIEKLLIELTIQFRQDSHHVNSLVDGLLEDAKRVVMLPLSTLLDSFPVMVRNISRELGKEIHFSIEGGDIELDKRILEELKDPLLHLIRNSIDHGIEMPAQRRHKEAMGHVKIAVTQDQSNELKITISDDGQGIDIDAIKRSAMQKGLVSKESIQQLNDQDALALVFLSGISTAPMITAISGNGLGMSIVREKVDQIGGHIRIHSERHHGTDIILTVPLTLATYKGVLLTVAGQLFVLPVVHIERIVRTRREDIHTIEGQRVISLDSKTLPLVRMHEVLGMAAQAADVEEKYIPLIVINHGNIKIAFEVDEVHHIQEVIVKKLSKPLVRVKNISAVTILGTGMPVPILNERDLMAIARRGVMPVLSVVNQINDTKKELSQPVILIVEDSITTRMLLKNILEMSGYEVVTAVDGLDAWRILKETRISLVVSDVDMPRMDGFELTTKIRTDDKLTNLPVVLVTARAKQEDHERGIDVGANAYIIKSNFDDSNLLAVVKKLL